MSEWLNAIQLLSYDSYNILYLYVYFMFDYAGLFLF